MLVVGFGLVCAVSGARADAGHYAGLQLAPSVHLGLSGHVGFAGAGAELSFTKWLLVELQLSGLARADRDVPGWVRTSLGLYSRLGGSTHTFVYGTGVSYNNRVECPFYCTIFAAMAGPEENRTAFDLWTADVGGGYEARLASSFFVRGLARFEIPLHLSKLTNDDGSTSLPSIQPGGDTDGYCVCLYP